MLHVCRRGAGDASRAVVERLKIRMDRISGISGSIEGEAIQKDMIGARGTPLISNPAMIGMTVQEQKGLNAPTKVATRIATPTLAENARLITLSSLRTRMNTLRIMLIRNQGQTCQIAKAINCPI